MKFFKTDEIKVISVIFFVLSVSFIYNLKSSYRRSRDLTRKDDISLIQQLVESYHARYKIYPLSNEDGLIIGCFEKNEILDLSTGYPTNAEPCIWGESNFQTGQTTPRDPDYKKGVKYIYQSETGKDYKVYVALEGKDEPEYQESTRNENLQCGSRICNYKRTVL